MAHPAEPVRHMIEKTEKPEPIAIVGEDLLTSIPAGRDVVDPTGKQESGRSCHGQSLRLGHRGERCFHTLGTP
jgi:hypothetical protein